MAREPSFGERMGIVQPKAVQLKEMDQSLRTALWNPLFRWYFEHGQSWVDQQRAIRAAQEAFRVLRWDLHDFGIYKAVARINKYLLEGAEWWQVYGFIEQLFDHLAPDDRRRMFIAECELALEAECSGYRLIEHKFVPITNPTELAEVDAALAATSIPKLEVVHKQLEGALSKLAEKPTPNYKNAITEAISAAESLAKIVAKDPKGGTFGSVLPELARTTGMPEELREGLRQLWKWTCDVARHGPTAPKNIDGAEARFALITCSALINFVVAKLPDVRA